MCTCAGIAPGYPQHESYCGTDPAELWDRYDEQFETYIADPANDPGEDVPQDILDCMVSDAWTYTQADGYEDFCS